ALEFSNHRLYRLSTTLPRPADRRGRLVRHAVAQQKCADGQSAQGSAVAKRLTTVARRRAGQVGYPAYNRRSAADHSMSRVARQALTVASKRAGSSSYQTVPPGY